MRPIHTHIYFSHNHNKLHPLDNTMEYSYHHLIAAATLLLVAAFGVLFSTSKTSTTKLVSHHGSSSKSSTLLRRMTELNNVDYEVVNNQNSNKDLVLPNVLLIGAQQSGTTSVSLCIWFIAFRHLICTQLGHHDISHIISCISLAPYIS